MHKKVSVSMDEEVLNKIQKKLKEGLFRSQSHLVEYATRKFLEK